MSSIMTTNVVDEAGFRTPPVRAAAAALAVPLRGQIEPQREAGERTELAVALADRRVAGRPPASFHRGEAGAAPAVEGEVLVVTEQAQRLTRGVRPEPAQREQAGAQRLGRLRREEVGVAEAPFGERGRELDARARPVAGAHDVAPERFV